MLDALFEANQNVKRQREQYQVAKAFYHRKKTELLQRLESTTEKKHATITVELLNFISSYFGKMKPSHVPPLTEPNVIYLFPHAYVKRKTVLLRMDHYAWKNGYWNHIAQRHFPICDDDPFYQEWFAIQYLRLKRAVRRVEHCQRYRVGGIEYKKALHSFTENVHLQRPTADTWQI